MSVDQPPPPPPGIEESPAPPPPQPPGDAPPPPPSVDPPPPPPVDQPHHASAPYNQYDPYNQQYPYWNQGYGQYPNYPYPGYPGGPPMPSPGQPLRPANTHAGPPRFGPSGANPPMPPPPGFPGVPPSFGQFGGRPPRPGADPHSDTHRPRFGAAGSNAYNHYNQDSNSTNPLMMPPSAGSAQGFPQNHSPGFQPRGMRPPNASRMPLQKPNVFRDTDYRIKSDAPTAPAPTSSPEKPAESAPQSAPDQPVKKKSQKTPPPSEWPPSLTSYVQRSFKACCSEKAKDMLEKHLKDLITQIFKDGTAYSKDWDKIPFPDCVHLRANDDHPRLESPKRKSSRRSDRSYDRNRDSSRSKSRSRERDKKRDRRKDSPRRKDRGSRHRKQRSDSERSSDYSSDEEVTRSGGRSKKRFDPGSREDYSSSNRRERRSMRKYNDLDAEPREDSSPGNHQLSTELSNRLNRGLGRGRGGFPASVVEGPSTPQDNGYTNNSPGRGFNERGRGDRGGRGFRGNRGRGVSERGGRGGNRNREMSNTSNDSNLDGVEASSETDSPGFGGRGRNRGGQNRGNNRNKPVNVKPDKSIFDQPMDRNDPKLQERAARFQKVEQDTGPQAVVGPRPVSASGPRFMAGSAAGRMSDLPDSELDMSNLAPIIGTSTKLTKQYLRLTEAPDPSSVRPLEVLKQSLDYIKDHWKKNKDYMYVCDQLRSVRQDLMVQCIRNDFTVTVYEVHARIAIEQGDYQDLNQCQTQLKALYNEGIEGCCWEFTAYRLHYYIFTNSPNDCIHYMRTLTPEANAHVAVKHALAVFKAWAHGNYVQFFRLYKQAPLMSGYMMDLFVLRERKKAVKLMHKVYRPTLEVSFITGMLAFDSDEDTLALLSSEGYVLEKNSLDCRKAPVVVD